MLQELMVPSTIYILYLEFENKITDISPFITLKKSSKLSCMLADVP